MSPVTPTAPPRPRSAASFPTALLDQVVRESLDPAYAEAAARRAGRPDAPRPQAARRPAAATLAALVAMGLLFVVAVVQTRMREPADADARRGLVAQVQRRSAQVDAQSARLTRLRSSTADAGAALLATSAAGTALSGRLRDLEVAAGAVALRGPGLRVRLDDAPAPAQPLSGDPGRTAASGAGANRVLDVDLQVVVNALWAAGAEAVAVNGIRMTALTAIRTAGEAILVDQRPLSPPYDVVALGDPSRLEPAFAGSDAWARMRTLAQTYGIAADYRRVEQASVPGAGSLQLRVARPVGATS